MKKWSSVWILYFILINLVLTFALGIGPEEYSSEFNNQNEVCSYRKPLNFYYENINKLSEIYFYTCCEQSSCIVVPFDYTRMTFENKETTYDFFKSEQAIRYVTNGKIIGSAYQFGNNFDLCNFMSDDTLREESTNLVAQETYKYRKVIFQSENIKKVTTIYKAAKTLGVIKEFNPTSFIISFSCSSALKKEEDALTAIATCYPYYHILEQGVGYRNQVTELINCDNDAVTKIETAQDDLFVKIHTPVQVISKIISFFINLINNPTKLKADEMPYEIFDRAGKQIPENTKYLGSNEFEATYVSAFQRIQFKTQEAKTAIDFATNSYNHINSLKHPFLLLPIINFIYNSNFNYSNADPYFKNASIILENSNQLYDVSKFNSATKKSKEIFPYLYEAQNLVNAENCKERHIGWEILFVIALLVILFIIVNKFVLINEDYLYTINLILILIGVSLVLAVFFGHTNRDMCNPHVFISRFNDTIHEPYFIEENYTYQVNLTKHISLFSDGQPIKKPIVPETRKTSCLGNPCKVTVELLNLLEYPLNVNVIYNVTIFGSTSNRSIPRYISNSSLSKKDLSELSDLVGLNSGESAYLVDADSIQTEVLENEFVIWKDQTEFFNVTELRNFTRYNEISVYRYVINITN
jgi:hypothetical protein